MSTNESEYAGLPVVELLDDEQRLALILATVQRLILEHPIAAGAAIKALRAEGRVYAETAAGSAWLARLKGSALVHEGRILWEVLTANTDRDFAQSILPSELIEVIASSVSSTGFEAKLQELLGEAQGYAER